MNFTTKNTRREAPIRVAIYGTGGIGKSTFASQAPSTIFVCAEDGLENIDATAIEPHPKTWEDVIAALAYAETLDRETVVIDSLDWLEPLCWDYVVRAAMKPKTIKGIEDFGYGKGYTAALDQWRVFLHKLSALRAKGMNVVLIAHATRRAFKNPIGDDYEHFTIKLHEKAAGLLVEWCDVVGLAQEDVSTEDTSGRMKAQTSGKRIIRTNPHPAYLAKTRFAMPPKIPLNWQSFAQAVRDGGPAAIERLKGDFESKIRELADNDLEVSARAFVAQRGVSVPSLSEAIATLDSYLEDRKKAS